MEMQQQNIYRLEVQGKQVPPCPSVPTALVVTPFYLPGLTTKRGYKFQVSLVCQQKIYASPIKM